MKKKLQLAVVLSLLALLLASCSTRAYYDQAKGQSGQQSIFANGQTWSTDAVTTVPDTAVNPVADAAVTDGSTVILDATQMADDVVTSPPVELSTAENPVSVDTPSEVEVPVVTPQLVNTAIPVDLMEPAWFDDALFIGGDVCGTLAYYAEHGNGGLGDALFLTRTSFTLASAVNGSMALAYRGGWYSVPDAVRASGCSKVFLVLGIEDIGRAEDEAYKKLWSDLITAIQEANPDVRIFVESITPVASGHDNSRINNTKINAYNDYLKDYCSRSGCNYVDVNTGLKDANGNLDSKLCRDGYYLFRIDAGETWASLLRNPNNYAFDPRG